MLIILIIAAVLVGIAVFYLIQGKQDKPVAPYKVEAPEVKEVVQPVPVAKEKGQMAKPKTTNPKSQAKTSPAKPKAEKAKVTADKKKPSAKPKKAKPASK